ncbi:hypothetical protein [Streptomyces acidiscabies]|uniref:hypothetical protein n=1 Tax=Streptomyces acidiscabies TaxID=42234 RepID=UPI00095329AC|nr:hypothetical protein [Streptomyces acidiscabies]
MADPQLLLPPEVLYRTDQFVVWHTGLVRGPVGAVVTLVVDGVDGTAWEDFDPIGPAGVTLRGPDSPGFLVPFQEAEGAARRYRVTGLFGDVDVRGTWVEFWVRELGVHALRFVGEPVRGEVLPFAVVPEVLYREAGMVVWHPGVVRGPSGLFVSLEVRAERGELLGAEWELGERPIGVTSSAGDSSETVVGGERALRAYGWFGGGVGERGWVRYDVRPLGVRRLRAGV